MTKKYYIKELPRALFIGVMVFVVIILIKYLNGVSISIKGIKWTLFYSILYSVSLHFSNTFLFISLEKLFRNKEFTKTRIFVGFISSFLLSLGVTFLLRIFEEVVIEKATLLEFIRNEAPKSYIFSSIVTFIVILIIHFIYLYKYYQENKLKEQKIIAGTANAKFESLKNQIDPHFLFNSLNVLNALIEENPEMAQKFTTSLSKIYRYVLEQKDKELVFVAEELDFAKTYMNLLKMRFENNLDFTISYDGIQPEAKVVPLSLQLLLENTVKHNIISEQKPLRILIYATSDYLCIENNYQKKEVLEKRQGVGLQNIIDRYSIISNRKVLIEDDEKIFVVKIPILTKQVLEVETEQSYLEKNAYERAKKRVSELKGFYGNLTAYCIVIPIQILINMSTIPQFQWFWFPLFGWGIGIFIHWLTVFGHLKNWEERKIQSIMNTNLKNKFYL